MATDGKAIGQRAQRGTNADTQIRRHLPRRWGRIIVAGFAVIAGAVGGGLYARAVATTASPRVIIVGVLGGMALGYLAVAVPRLAWHFLLREWYRTVANHWRRLLHHHTGRTVRSLDDAGEPSALADRGIAHYLNEKYAEASADLEKATRMAGDDVRLLNALAATRAAQQDWSGAAAALAEAIETDPDDTISRQNIAMLLVNLPPTEHLPEQLRVQIDRAGPAARNNLAVRALQNDDIDTAWEILRETTEGTPLYPYAQANLGVCAYREYDTERAVVHLADAAQFAPTDPDILSDFGTVLAIRGDLSEAVRTLRRARKIDAHNAAAVVNLGAALAQQDKPEEALEVLNELPPDSPREAECWINCAYANRMLGENGQAREYAEDALAEKPNMPEARTCMGVALWHLGKYETAHEHLQRARTLAADSILTSTNAARAAISVAEPEEALEILETLEDRRAHDSDLVFDFGVTNLMIALKRRKPEMNRTERDLYNSALHRAVVAFQDHLQRKDSHEYRTRFNLGLTSYLQSNSEIAAEHFEAATKLRPEDHEAHFCAGTAWAEAAEYIQEERGEGSKQLVPAARRAFQKAKKHLQKATTRGEAAADVFNNLGLVCYELGQIDEAMKALRRLVQLEDSVDANNSLALAYARQGQEAYNSSLVERVRARVSGETSFMAEAKKLLSTAIHYFSEALRYEPRNPVLHSNIGLAYLLRNRPNDIENALYHWKRMRETGGDWAERQFERMVSVMNVDDKNAKAQFHDVGRSLRPIGVAEYLRVLPPEMGEPIYIVDPVFDADHWHLEAEHRDLEVALRARDRISSIERRLQRLAI